MKEKDEYTFKNKEVMKNKFRYILMIFYIIICPVSFLLLHDEYRKHSWAILCRLLGAVKSALDPIPEYIYPILNAPLLTQQQPVIIQV